MYVLCQSSRDLQNAVTQTRLRARLTSTNASVDNKPRPASAFVSTPKYTRRAKYDPEKLNEDIAVFVRGLFPIETLKEMRKKLQPRARVKWFTELLGHQNSPQTRDLPYDVDFGDYEKVLTAFLRRNTLPPNLGWDWELPDKLDLEKHTPLIGPTMEEYTENLLEKGEGFDNDNDLLTGISYTQWWEQPVVLTIFSEGIEYREKTREAARERMQKYMKDVLMFEIKDVLQYSLRQILETPQIPKKILKEYEAGTPEFSAEMKEKLHKLLATVPDAAVKSASPFPDVTVAEAVHREVERLSKAIGLDSVDGKTKKIIQQGLADMITQPQILAKEMESVFRGSTQEIIEDVFSTAAKLAEEEGLPQFVPLIKLLSENMIPEPVEEIVSTIKKDVPGLFTFMLYRVMGSNPDQYVTPSVNFTVEQAEKYCQVLRKEAARIRKGHRSNLLERYKMPQSRTELEPVLRKLANEYEQEEEAEGNLDFLGTDEFDDSFHKEEEFVDRSDRFSKRSENPIPESELINPKMEIPEHLEHPIETTPEDQMDRGQISEIVLQRTAIISFQHAKLLLSESVADPAEHYVHIQSNGVGLRQRAIDIPPRWLWAFKKVMWPKYDEDLRDTLLEKHAPSFSSGVDEHILHEAQQNKLSE